MAKNVHVLEKTIIQQKTKQNLLALYMIIVLVSWKRSPNATKGGIMAEIMCMGFALIKEIGLSEMRTILLDKNVSCTKRDFRVSLKTTERLSAPRISYLQFDNY